MSKTKHTPGPWVWEFHPQHPTKVIALADDRHHHADVLLCTGTGEEAWGDIEKADRDLISAAPMLLQAWLDYIEQWNVRHDDPKCPMDDTCECPLVDRINAAIAKAEGR